MQKYFTREDTKVIKGIAVVLMLMHHLWQFPERVAGGELKYFITIFNQSLPHYLGTFGKLCVPLFFFLGGYGIYKAAQVKKFDVFGKLKGLYLAYWKVFVIFIPIGFFFFSHQIVYCESIEICNRFQNFSFTELINNFTAVTSTYNREWWFIWNYVIVIITYPLLAKITNHFSDEVNLAIITGFAVLLRNVTIPFGDIEVLGFLNWNFIYKYILAEPYLVYFWMGIVFAKGNLLEKIKNGLEENKLLNPALDLIYIFVLIFFRQISIGVDIEFVYVPFFIVFCLDFLNYCRPLRKIFFALGKESTNMWLIHSFFCYYFYFFVKIVVAPRYAILSLLVLLAMSYVASLMVTLFWNRINLIFTQRNSQK